MGESFAVRRTSTSNSAGDTIDVAAVDAKTGTAGINGFTQFLGSAPFTAEATLNALDTVFGEISSAILLLS